MKVRVISACVGILLLAGIVAASFFYPFVWNIAVAVLTGMAVHEAVAGTHCCRNKNIRNLSVAFGASASLIVLIKDCAYILAAVAAVYVMLVFLLGMKDHDDVSFKNVASVLSLTFIVTATFLCVAFTQNINGVASLLLTVAMAWISDTFALFSGMLFGKHKLAPVISPKKTVEGAVGGFVMSVVLCTLLGWLYGVKTGVDVKLDYLAITAAVCSPVSMLGDLSFSYVKRYYKIKDYGKIMPGHGGVLDRFDSVLFVAPVFIILNHYIPIVAA